MNDATLTWTKSLTGTPTRYVAVLTVNGAVKPPITVPATAAGDAAGYSLDAANALGTTFSPGDVIGASVQAVDSVNSLSSGVVVSTPVTVQIPTVPIPPGSPQNVTLVLS